MGFFKNEHGEQVRQMFADQFEADGSNFLYRKSSKGPPIRVSAEERDRFISAFDKRAKYLVRGIVGVMIAVIFASNVFLGGATHQDWLTWLLVLVTVVAILPLHRWIWNAPARELSVRLPVGTARSTAEVRRRMISRISYAYIIGLAVAGSALPLAKIDWQQDLFSDANILWSIIVLFFAIWTAWIVYMKARVGEGEA